MSLKNIIKFVIFLGVGLLLFYITFQNFEAKYLEECAKNNILPADCSLTDKLIGDFKSVKLFWIVLILVLYMISNIARALRWHQLLEPLGHKPKLVNTFGSLMIGYFANLALPRVGEVIKIGTISGYEDIPFEEATGTVVVDRILDFISLFAVIGIAFLLSFSTLRDFIVQYMPGKTVLYLLLGLLLLGSLGLYVFNKIISGLTSENPIINKVQNLWVGFRSGITSLKDVSNLPLLILYTVLIWTLYYLMTYLCFKAFLPTVHLGPVAGIVVFVFGSLGMIVPSPGGMGSYQFAISQALIIYGINSADAFSFSNIIFFTITLFGNILFGLISLIILPIYNK